MEESRLYGSYSASSFGNPLVAFSKAPKITWENAMHLDHERARLSRGGSAACSSPTQGHNSLRVFGWKD